MSLLSKQHFSLIRSIRIQWKTAFATKKFLLCFSLTVLYLVGLIIFQGHFLPFVNHRQGTKLNSIFLQYLPSFDFSVEIFTIIYASLLITIWYVLDKPKQFLRFLVTAALMYTLRSITLYLVPLEPPAGCIPLADPFITRLAYHGEVITKDLFFSGHTALMFIFILVVRKRYVEIGLCAGLIAVIIMLLFQHAHYLIDIAGAFIAVPLCWVTSRYLLPYRV